MVRSGAELNKIWKVGALHALYFHDGNWYHQLKKFPGALFDDHGYILFRTEEDYKSCDHLTIYETNQVAVRKPGISAIPGYVRVNASEIADVDVHFSKIGIEGAKKLRIHLVGERDRSIVEAKKKSAKSLKCEVCGFLFREVYKGLKVDYCEAHHLVPFQNLEENAEVRLEDLAILCANCHRVAHLKYPPYPLQKIREMLL